MAKVDVFLQSFILMKLFIAIKQTYNYGGLKAFNV